MMKNTPEAIASGRSNTSWLHSSMKSERKYTFGFKQKKCFWYFFNGWTKETKQFALFIVVLRALWILTVRWSSWPLFQDSVVFSTKKMFWGFFYNFFLKRILRNNTARCTKHMYFLFNSNLSFKKSDSSFLLGSSGALEQKKTSI